MKAYQQGASETLGNVPLLHLTLKINGVTSKSYELDIKFCIKTPNAEKMRLAARTNELRLRRHVNQ